jgi:hypothetical protein
LNSTAVQVGLVLKKWQWGRFFSEFFGFLNRLSLHQHSILSSIMRDLCSGLTFDLHTKGLSITSEQEDASESLWSGSFCLKMISRRSEYLDCTASSSAITEERWIGKVWKEVAMAY